MTRHFISKKFPRILTDEHGSASSGWCFSLTIRRVLIRHDEMKSIKMSKREVSDEG
jgi:hypothetical protein